MKWHISCREPGLHYSMKWASPCLHGCPEFSASVLLNHANVTCGSQCFLKIPFSSEGNGIGLEEKHMYVHHYILWFDKYFMIAFPALQKCRVEADREFCFQTVHSPLLIIRQEQNHHANQNVVHATCIYKKKKKWAGKFRKQEIVLNDES